MPQALESLSFLSFYFQLSWLFGHGLISLLMATSHSSCLFTADAHSEHCVMASLGLLALLPPLQLALPGQRLLR